MSELSQIPNASESSLELLEAAGFRFLKEVAKLSEQGLTAELARANEVLKITEEAPGEEVVAGWIRHAREVLEMEEADEEVHVQPEIPVNYETLPQVSSLLQSGPFAIPMPGHLLEEQGLFVSDIPEGVLINHHVGDLDVQVDKPIPGDRADLHRGNKPSVQSVAMQPSVKPDMDFSKLKSFDEMGSPLLRQPGNAEEVPDERVALIRAPRVETNKGKNPNSRRYIRGVLHSHPFRIYFGAMLTLALMILTPLSVASAILLLLSRERPGQFLWVHEWWLAFPLALPVFGFLWLIWAFSGSCRICGQKLFVHRSHRKNAKAHHLPGIGYVLPLCVHILLFRWFRCTHCGTPVRLKQ